MSRIILKGLTSLTVGLRCTMCIDENEDELLIIEYSSVISWLIHTNSLVNICLRLTCPSTPQSSTFILAKALTTPDVVADLGGLETILLSHNPRCITVSMPDVKLNRANLLARKIVGAFPQVTQAGLLRLSSNSSEQYSLSSGYASDNPRNSFASPLCPAFWARRGRLCAGHICRWAVCRKPLSL